MAPGVRLSRPDAGREPRSLAWPVLSAVLAAGALLAWAAPPALLDWQPALAWREPWRWWTAAFVHWSPLHLGANLAGCALVGAWGWRAGAGARHALAWAAAWPVTHLALSVQPTLRHYGGLSGVLHAGVAVAATALVLQARGRDRLVGLLVLGGLFAKVLLEQPWGPALRHPPGWDVAVAPIGHAAGTLAGSLFALVALAGARPKRTPPSPPSFP